MSMTTSHVSHYIYALQKIARVIEPGLTAEQLMLGGSSVHDTEHLVRKLEERVRADRLALGDQKLAADLAEAKLAEVTKDLEDARAEIAAMVEDRRSEEERARMRLLETAFKSEVMTERGLPTTSLMPRLYALRGSHEPYSSEQMMAALLADLDALVALGLRGEVVQ